MHVLLQKVPPLVGFDKKKRKHDWGAILGGENYACVAPTIYEAVGRLIRPLFQSKSFKFGRYTAVRADLMTLAISGEGCNESSLGQLCIHNAKGFGFVFDVEDKKAPCGWRELELSDLNDP